MSTLQHAAPPRQAGTKPAAARSDYGSTLAITSVLAFAAVLLALAAQLLVIHPGTSPYARLVIEQRQTVKTDLYLGAFLLALPLALIVGPRLADRVALGPNASALPTFASALVASLAAALILVRLSARLPWGDGVRSLLVVIAIWWALAAIACWRVLRGPRWPSLERLHRTWPGPVALAAVLVFGAILCVTSARSRGAIPLVVGAAAAAVVLLAYGRVRLPRLGRWGAALDVLALALLLLAIPDLVIFRNPTGIPAIYFDPGIVQFQHDYILGPTNQLLGGGALLVNDPVSQYGVGLIYFLGGYFRLVPIGYGTFGFLDGVLTALFYMAGYAVLRLAGVRRPLAAAAFALAVLTFAYNFGFFVGQLPEEGPLRFGLPMVVLLGSVAALRLPRSAGLAQGVVLCGLGVSAVWALEAFAYTTVTYLAIVAAGTWLCAPGSRRRFVARRLALGVAAIVAAHLVFAVATLAGSGHLPDWGQYLAYAREFLFGGQAGSITYGFSRWSPGVAVDGAALLSAAALVLLALRRPNLARTNPVHFVALAGSTAYAIAVLSYTDNRSSTYLLLYVALPLLIAGTLWLSLVLTPASGRSLALRRSALGAALAVSVLLLAGAWPAMATHFNRSALGHFYPGGGFRSALHRLWHPPAIDPRAPVGIELLDRYAPARRALILFPTVPDLGTEILIRSHRANLLPIGDPKADGLVPTAWVPRVRAALARIGPGQRLLTDQQAFRVIADLRQPRVHVLTRAIDGGGVEVEWILHQLDERFRIVPVARARDGLILAALARR